MVESGLKSPFSGKAHTNTPNMVPPARITKHQRQGPDNARRSSGAESARPSCSFAAENVGRSQPRTPARGASREPTIGTKVADTGVSDDHRAGAAALRLLADRWTPTKPDWRRRDSSGTLLGTHQGRLPSSTGAPCSTRRCTMCRYGSWQLAAGSWPRDGAVRSSPRAIIC